LSGRLPVRPPVIAFKNLSTSAEIRARIKYLIYVQTDPVNPGVHRSRARVDRVTLADKI